MNPKIWWQLKDRGILIPYRTYRAAKKTGLRLSLVCALLTTVESFQQVDALTWLPEVASGLEGDNLHHFLRGFMYTDGAAIEVLERMSYFQSLGID